MIDISYNKKQQHVNTYQIPNGRKQYQATYEKSMSPDYWAELASTIFIETPFIKIMFYHIILQK